MKKILMVGIVLLMVLLVGCETFSNNQQDIEDYLIEEIRCSGCECSIHDEPKPHYIWNESNECPRTNENCYTYCNLSMPPQCQEVCQESYLKQNEGQ